MIKRFFKKHNKKILAFIGVLATTICGILGITNAYAYESDSVSYTLDTSNITKYGTSDFEGSNNNLIWEKNNLSDNYNLILNIPLLETLTGPNNDLVLLCNLIIQRRSSEASGWQNYVYNGTRNVIVTDTNNTQILSSPIYFNTYTQQTNNALVTYYGFMVQKSNNTNISQDISTIRLSLGSLFNNSYLYKVTIMNIDLVRHNEVLTLEYVNNYYGGIQAQLEQLQEDYDNLEDNYDTLQDNYDTLENDYNDLEDDYDVLQSEYDQLLEDYNALINTDTNGMWAYFAAFSIVGYNENNEAITLESYQTFNDFKNSQYNYLNNINIDLSNLKTRYPNYNKFGLVCVTDNNVPFLLNGLSYQINNNGNTCQNVIVLENISQQINIDYTQLIQMGFKVNLENINNIIQPYDQNRWIEIVGFVFQYDNNNNFSITSLSNEYNNGFITGYQSGQKDQQPYINSLNQDIENLNQQVTNLQTTINDLNYQINAINNQYGLNNLMWTIGGLPFESFKHIWNVNFFGINIADFILGFVTTFIGIYILKKFFF